MEIKKLNKKYESLIAKMEDDGEAGFAFFKKNWGQLTLEEREILKMFLSRYATMVFIANEKPVEYQMYWAAILNIIGDDNEEIDASAKLIKTKKMSDLQLAKLFYDLKRYGYIDNTLDEIANVLCNVFDVNYSTAFTYLNEPTRFEKCKPLFS